MPGICGIFDRARGESLAGPLSEMTARLKHHPWYQESSHVDPATGLALARVSLGFVNPAPQPAFNEDRSLLAVMEGEIYDEEKHRQALTAAGHQFHSRSQAELLVHGYEQSGQRFFAELNGCFVAVLWDARARRLLLVNDRFGVKPLYYASLPGRLLFASEIKALLVDPDLSRQPSWRGIAQLFTFGQLLGEDTLLDAIHLLPAAGWLTFEGGTGQTSLKQYAPLERPVLDRAKSEQDHLERIDQAFKQAVDRQVQGTEHLGLSLSGGLDSRAILGVLDPDQAITTVSMGMEGSLDHACAEHMARLKGNAHHQHVLDTRFLSRFEEHMRHMVHLTDGHYLCQCIVMPTLPLYRELGIQFLLRGHVGELMHMHKAYNFSMDAEALSLPDSEALEGWLSRRLQAYMLEAVDRPLFQAAHQDQLKALAQESLHSCFQVSEGWDPLIHRVWHLFLSQRTRRETGMSLVEFGSVVETRMPYLDHDLVTALLAAPPELKLGDKIQTYILRKRRPAFLDVVNANTGARMGAGRLNRLLSRIRLKVLAKLGVPGYQPYERLGLWLRRELRPVVERLLLSTQCLDRGVFNPETVRTVVGQHLANQHNHTYLLLAMMIFELGQRQLHGEESHTVPPVTEKQGLAVG
jgi:asparagine synthase (glutamine-hydrolysing)